MARRFDPFAENPGIGLDMDTVRDERVQQHMAIQEERRTGSVTDSGFRPNRTAHSNTSRSASSNRRNYTALNAYAATGRPVSAGAMGFVPSGPRPEPEKTNESTGGRGSDKSSRTGQASHTAGGGMGAGRSAGGSAGSAGSYRSLAARSGGGRKPTEFERKLAAGNIRGDVDYSESSSRQPQSAKLLASRLDEIDDATLETDVLLDSVQSPTSRDAKIPGSEQVVKKGERVRSADSVGSTGDLKSPSSASPPLLDVDTDDNGSLVAAPGSASSAGSAGRRPTNELDDEQGQVVGVADMDDVPRSPSPSLAYIDTGNVAEFVQRPASDDSPILCRVTKIDSIYYLHLEQPGHERKFLMAARSRRNARSKDFLISLDSTDISKDSPGYMGKLQCNLTRTEFTLYDSGTNPAKSETLPDFSNAREELAAVIYGTTSLLAFAAGPRRMHVVLPHLNQDHERIKVQPRSEKQTLAEAYKNHTLTETTVVLQNKLPEWNPDNSSYVLNFHGRVTKPSAKNFQIIHPDDTKYIVLQFGRIGENQFTLDYCYPMCALQAFGVALACCHKNSQ